MRRASFSLRSLMVATGLIAVSFAAFGVVAGGILSAGVLAYSSVPSASRWAAVEIAATVAWLLGMALTASDVWNGSACFFLPTGFLLGVSWLLRIAAQSERPSRLTSAFTPASLLVAFALMATDLDFRLRLALSESALRAEASKARKGFHGHRGTSRQAGLFRASTVEERDGCVLWTTNVPGFWTTRGLAFVPGRSAPQWPEYRFEHVRGPWWRFTQNLD